MSRAAGILPATATLAVLVSAATSWWVTSDVLFFYVAYPLAGLVAAAMLFDKAPLAVSMGGLLVLLVAFTAVAYAAPILGEGGDEIIPGFPEILRLPLSAGLGIVAMVLVLVTRHDVVERPLLYGALFVAWLAFTALFFVPTKDLGSPLTSAALPGILCLALAGLGVKLTLNSAAPQERPVAVAFSTRPGSPPP